MVSNMAKVKQYQITCDILNMRGLTPAEVIALMEKIEFINQFHTNKLCEDKKRGRWYTRIKSNDHDKIYANSQEELIDKLYLFYGGINDFSFGGIFKQAIAKHTNDAGNASNTSNRSKRDFDRFITKDFAKKDIRFIKSSEIDAYIMSYLTNYEKAHDETCTDQVLYALKGIFNIVFRYATEGDYPILTHNPVPQDNTKYKKHTHSPKPKPSEKAFQPQEIAQLQDFLWNRVRTNHNYVVCANAYAVLFSIETGMRSAEICALKWADIDEHSIHIHSQILTDDEKLHTFKYAKWTKNEKGHSRDGRRFPLTEKIRYILNELCSLQSQKGIQTEWVFARANGNYMSPDDYRSALRKIAKKDGLALENNHAFRMALNSYVFIPLGIVETERAKLLGHSVDVNLKHYTFALDDDKSLEQTRTLLDGSVQKTVCTQRVPNIIDFEQKKRTLQAAKLKGSCK